MGRIFLLAGIFLLFIQCNKQKEFKITRDEVGKLTKNTSKEAIIELFKNDSLVMFPKDEKFVNEYIVYRKGGKHLLSIFPKMSADSLHVIERIHIYSPDYKTEKGISVASTYRDVAANYTFDKIDPTFTSAIIYLDEINGTIVLEKSDLGLAEDDLNTVRKEQIPDHARIKYLTVWFD
jgi:hypothetical protein